MRVLIGTSGFSYKEWKGKFYPEDLAADGMLAYYASKLPTVEINNTFYRMPNAKLVGSWASEVPDTFLFAIKAPQRITHIKRLKDAEELTNAFLRVIQTLGPKLGPVVFQLPPFFRKDTPRLVEFLALLPETLRAAFEFRHASWFADDVYDALGARKATLCAAESEKLESPVVATADWGYMRLRRTDYTEADLDAWAARIRSQTWNDVFVYVKHDEGDAPLLAKRLADRLA
jgi:uncharacterized protein YecE (DUF72 family)